MTKRTSRKRRHGEAVKGSESVEYRTWSRMKTRCTNPNDAGYHRYGGRGIAVCARWASSFEAFLADVGRRPGPGYSIDRIDNDGDYKPGNVRWTTRAQQTLNYSRNRSLTFDGKTLTISQWSAETGLNEATIGNRLDRYGWPVEAALTLPPRATAGAQRGKDRKTHCVNGHPYTPETSGRNNAGWRFCRICSRERQTTYMRKVRKAARKARSRGRPHG